MIQLALTPMDAWFFRDGRPYTEKEANQTDVPSVFPPSSRTLSGALRAALARSKKWNGNGSWSSDLESILGNGPNNLGSMRFTGPFLIRETQTLWPLPRHLLGRNFPSSNKWEPMAFLRPGNETFFTDAGEIKLPAIAASDNENAAKLKTAENVWITTSGLTEILNGQRPSADEVFRSKDLWTFEPRVGHRRNEQTRATEKRALYSPTFIRLQKNVALGVAVNGLPENADWAVPPLFPFGGESRLAQADSWSGNPIPAAPEFPADDLEKHFTITLLTPGCFDAPELPGVEIVSACVGKPQLIGGWDSLAREPLPLEAFAPAGSTWFCKAAAKDFPNILKQHSRHLGKYNAHGFGQIVIGHWPKTNSSSSKP